MPNEELATFEGQLSSLSPEDISGYVTGSEGAKYSQETVTKILAMEFKNAGEVFYFLSKENTTITADGYTSTYIHRAISAGAKNHLAIRTQSSPASLVPASPVLGEEQIYYICEGIKLQLDGGNKDFYYICHHFFMLLEEFECVQMLLIETIKRHDFQMKEVIITCRFPERIIAMVESSALANGSPCSNKRALANGSLHNNKRENEKAKNFQAKKLLIKFLTLILNYEDYRLVREYIKEKGLKSRIRVSEGCLQFAKYSFKGYEEILQVD